MYSWGKVGQLLESKSQVEPFREVVRIFLHILAKRVIGQDIVSGKLSALSISKWIEFGILSSTSALENINSTTTEAALREIRSSLHIQDHRVGLDLGVNFFERNEGRARGVEGTNHHILSI